MEVSEAHKLGQSSIVPDGKKLVRLGLAIQRRCLIPIISISMDLPRHIDRVRFDV